MIDMIQEMRSKLGEGAHPDSPSRIAVELNTSCPNVRGSPPPAYSFSTILLPLLHVLAEHYRRDPTLTIGLKLAPFVTSSQFEEAIAVIASFSQSPDDTTAGQPYNPFAFFTCTNTLGSSLLFAGQTTPAATAPGSSTFALPPVLGGLAGESIHALSLGNVYSFSQMITQHPDETVRNIKIIGVGGVLSPEAARRMKEVGACVVGCATLLGREGVAGFQRLL
jgi:dihydroorotate dehydrogenase (fumarate)